MFSNVSMTFNFTCSVSAGNFLGYS